MGRQEHIRGKTVRKWTYLALLMFAAAPAAFAADSVIVQKPVSINDDADVPQAVLDECKLDSEVPDAVAAKAKAAGVTTTFAEKVSGSEKGRTLQMEITDVVSDGNAFLGHHKSMTVKGKLYQDGNVVATFRDRRNSMTVVAVNNKEFDGDTLKDAVTAAKTDKAPIELLVKNFDTYKTIKIDYHEGLKYPHLERDKGKPDWLSELYKAK